MDRDHDAADQAMSEATPEVVVGQGVAAWLPSLLAIAMLAPPIRQALLASLGENDRSLVGHAVRIKDAVITGMCQPNGSYATSAVAAHMRLGIDPDLVGLVWAACVTLPLAAEQTTYDNYGQYWLAARGFGRDMGVPNNFLGLSPADVRTKVTNLAISLASGPVDIEAVGAFWGLIRHPHIQQLLDHLTDDEVVRGMLGVLPPELIAVINRP